MTDYEITAAMIMYGGSFAAQLGRLFRLADPENQQKLKAAFPEYFIQYHDLALTRLQQRRA
jgi:ABC-type transporter MlaC component